MTDDEDPLDLNFWPAFADLMLALTFVLVLVIFLVAFGMQAGNVGVDQIREKQEELATTVATLVNGAVQRGKGAGQYEICVDGDCPIRITNDIQLQRITFSDRVLFASGEHNLSAGGRDVLAKVGEALLGNIGSIYKIQIEGHTDDVPAGQYREGNLELGALRAIAVYRFLQVNVGVDPATNLMSATSFGEFSPVDRVEGAPYSPELVAAANKEDSGPNRRVELLLFYRRPGSTSTVALAPHSP